ncbi:MAG TPA: hypothetical protein GX747_03885 [Tenericutes bacterium]|nr:hypothetical protein [Mycoplasmatota bacterium]
MKEAAGEANMTVITILLIAIVAAVATPLITNLMSSSAKKTCCTNAGGRWAGNNCTDGGNTYYDASTYTDCISNL